jgi:hypothetical protein
VELKEGTRRLQIWRKKVDVETIAEFDDTTHISEEDTLSHREGKGVLQY